MRPGERGFTLIELLVVLAIVALLLTLSLPRYFQSIEKTKEVTLAENLRVTRDALDKFYADAGKYPDSLQELVDRRYLRALPFDPIAERSDAWIITAPEDAAKGKVFTIRSSATGSTHDGKPYVDF